MVKIVLESGMYNDEHALSRVRVPQGSSGTELNRKQESGINYKTCDTDGRSTKKQKQKKAEEVPEGEKMTAPCHRPLPPPHDSLVPALCPFQLDTVLQY